MVGCGATRLARATSGQLVPMCPTWSCWFSWINLVAKQKHKNLFFKILNSFVTCSEYLLEVGQPTRSPDVTRDAQLVVVDPMSPLFGGTQALVLHSISHSGPFGLCVGLQDGRSLLRDRFVGQPVDRDVSTRCRQSGQHILWLYARHWLWAAVRWPHASRPLTHHRRSGQFR